MSNLKNSKIKKFNRNFSRGFSLVEALVATAIIVMATVGPLGLAGRALSQANYIKDQIVATFLAQEGLEIMRNVRDSSGISQIVTLYNNGAGICAGVNSCSVSGIDAGATGYRVSACGNSCPYLDYDSENNLYCYRNQGGVSCPGTGSAASIYKRSITIYKIAEGKEYQVLSSVTWARGYGTRSIVLSENLFERTW